MATFARIAAALLGCVLALYSVYGFADVRVLMRFDESGHQMHRIIRIDSISSELRLSKRLADTIKLLSAENSATVEWMDASSEVIKREVISDPRITHAPATGELAHAILLQGAYMLTGPTGSMTVIIQLPANSAIGLQAERWRVELAG